MSDAPALYTVHLTFPGHWPRSTAIELTPAEIPRKGDRVVWTTEPVRASEWSDPRPQYLNFRVTGVAWALSHGHGADHVVYLNLEPEED